MPRQVYFENVMHMDSKADKLWASFSSNVSEWTGLWTIWDAKARKVKDVYNGVRSLKALNEEKTIVQQQNTYYHRDGAIRKPDPWEIRKEFCDDHGICHPAKPDLRAVLHDNRSGVWVSQVIPDGQSLFNEMFLQLNDEVRCSVGVMYDDSKKLIWFSGIREHKLQKQKEFWSSNVELRTELHVQNQEEEFIGIEKTLDRTLELSIKTDCHWDKQYWKQSLDDSSDFVFFLPDNICLSCPNEISTDGFRLRACVMCACNGDTEIQELMVTYANGHFVSVTQGIYRPFKEILEIP